MEKIYVAIIFLGLGTYLIRVLPFILGKNSHLDNSTFQVVLKYLGPCLIASLFVSSLSSLDTPINLYCGLKLFFGLGVIFVGNCFFKNIGLSVLMGIICYAGTGVFIRYIFGN